MKKSIIAASAASVALAAMPVMGTFAATKGVTDNLSVTLDSTCSLTRTGASADGTWTPGDPESTSAGQYTIAHMDAGTTATFGTSTFTIVCNDTTSGHSLDVRATGLAGQSGIAGQYIDYSSNAVAAGTSGWNITISDVQGFGMGEGVAPVAGIVGVNYSGTDHQGTANLYGGTTTSKNNVADATFKAQYKVGTSTTQAAGMYTGSAVYTLTHGA